MVNTTYQEIWNTFVNIVGVVGEDLPQDDEGKYILINSGILRYNSLTEDSEKKIISNDFSEEINVSLDYNRLLLLCNCIKFIYLENEKNEYEAIWGIFS